MSDEPKEKNEKEHKPDEEEGQVEVEYITENKKSVKETEDKKEQTRNLRNRLKKKETELKLLKKKLEEIKDDYLRKLAEMENLRKRLEREKNEYYQYALSTQLKEILDVLDNFERALEKRNQGEEEGLRKGVEMIYKQLRGYLLRQGVKPIEIEDKKFNPHLHQAFLTEESNQVTEPQVAEELQKGYMIHDRLLRPSLVKVLIPKKEREKD
jgi:molecular chaperone GrpE